MQNRLQAWLYYTDPSIKQEGVDIRKVLMPDSLEAKEKELLMYLYTQILFTTPEGFRLLKEKDPYNSYLYIEPPKSLQKVDIQSIADDVKGLNIVNEAYVSTSIDYLYEILIYILENHL